MLDARVTDANQAVPWRSVIEERVRKFAQERPDDVAFVGPRRSLTWAELDAAADRGASDLARRGVGPGDRVGWLGRNDIGFPVTLLATWRRRATLVGLNWRLSAQEIARVIGSASLAILVTDERCADLVGDRDVIETSRIVLEGTEAPWSASPIASDAELEPSPDDPAFVYFTSGSTGNPKAAELIRSRNERVVVEALIEGMDESAVLLVIPPVFHVAGSMWVQHGLYAGARVILDPGAGDSTLLENLAYHAVTHALMVPTLIKSLLDQYEREPLLLPSLRQICYGTAPITASLLEAARRTFDCRFTQVYGSTEAGGVVTRLTPDDHELFATGDRRLASAGRPIAGIEISIRDPSSHRECPTGEEGEIWIASPFVMGRYVGDPMATADVLVGGRWLRSRDVGSVDADGYVYVAGRLDDMIITGGENVHPAEVEEVLASIPEVEESSVFGEPDDRWGQRVVAAVVSNDPSLDAATVIAKCQDRLARYKCPSRVVFVTALPRTATGKVSRSSLRDLLAAGRANPT